MSTSPLKVLRQVATTVGLGMMLGVVSKANYALESMSDLERLHEAASKKKDLREMDRTREQIESKREIVGRAGVKVIVSIGYSFESLTKLSVAYAVPP